MTTITQGIITRYLRATNHRGARIKARAWAGSITIPYPHELDHEQAHRAAAHALADKLGWQGTFAQGGHPDDGGYLFVNVAGAAPRYGQAI